MNERLELSWHELNFFALSIVVLLSRFVFLLSQVLDRHFRLTAAEMGASQHWWGRLFMRQLGDMEKLRPP